MTKPIYTVEQIEYFAKLLTGKLSSKGYDHVLRFGSNEEILQSLINLSIKCYELEKRLEQQEELMAALASSVATK